MAGFDLLHHILVFDKYIHSFIEDKTKLGLINSSVDIEYN